jgi:hypothetical protein
LNELKKGGKGLSVYDRRSIMVMCYHRMFAVDNVLRGRLPSLARAWTSSLSLSSIITGSSSTFDVEEKLRHQLLLDIWNGTMNESQAMDTYTRLFGDIHERIASLEELRKRLESKTPSKVTTTTPAKSGKGGKKGEPVVDTTSYPLLSSPQLATPLLPVMGDDITTAAVKLMFPPSVSLSYVSEQVDIWLRAMRHSTIASIISPTTENDSKQLVSSSSILESKSKSPSSSTTASEEELAIVRTVLTQLGLTGRVHERHVLYIALSGSYMFDLQTKKSDQGCHPRS